MTTTVNGNADVIPLVDFSTVAINLNENEIDNFNLERCAAQVVEALEGVGFVYLKNHGIPKDQVKKAFQISKKFFSLDIETKRKYHTKSFKDCNHGFCDIGTEILDQTGSYDEIRESFNVDVIEGFPFPEEVEGFDKMVVNLFDNFAKLSRRLLILMGVGLKLKNKYFMKDCFSGDMASPSNKTTLRLLYYPPVIKKANVIRCAEHTDYAAITLLFQDDAGGLQVKRRDGTFMDATPIEDCILVNIGDMMQRWTADRLVSTVHRVLVPNSEEQQKKPRYSIVFFVNPENGTLLKCLDNSEKYPPMKCEDYLLKRILDSAPKKS